jgi:hypothetical protein
MKTPTTGKSEKISLYVPRSFIPSPSNDLPKPLIESILPPVVTVVAHMQNAPSAAF